MMVGMVKNMISIVARCAYRPMTGVKSASKKAQCKAL